MSMFAAEYEAADTHGLRRSARRPVSIDTGFGLGGLCRALCKVVDLSVHGCRLQTYSSMRQGETIWLRMPGLDLIAADVVWADDFLAGCQFRAPLAQTEYEQLSATAH